MKPTKTSNLDTIAEMPEPAPLPVLKKICKGLIIFQHIEPIRFVDVAGNLAGIYIYEGIHLIVALPYITSSHQWEFYKSLGISAIKVNRLNDFGILSQTTMNLAYSGDFTDYLQFLKCLESINTTKL